MRFVMKGGFQLPHVFGDFSGPTHDGSRFIRVFERQGLCMQRLAVESDGREPACVAPVTGIIDAVPYERQAGVGGLSPDLMFTAGFDVNI